MTGADPATRYDPIPPEVEEIGRAVLDAAFRVHTELGPGLLAGIDQACLVLELKRAGVDVQEEVEIP